MHSENSWTERLKLASGWLAVAVSFMFGFLALLICGAVQVWVGGDRQEWIAFLGIGILAVSFLASSVVALRKRRLAGILLLATTPVTSLCFTYAVSNEEAWRAGTGGVTTPTPVVLAVVALFFATIFAAWLTWTKKKGSLLVVMFGAVSLVLLCYLCRYISVVELLAVCGAPFLLIGAFWISTARLGWKELCAPRRRGLAKDVLRAALICGLVLALDAAASLIAVPLFSHSPDFECGSGPLITKKTPRNRSVFIARVIYAGTSYRTWKGLGLTRPEAVRAGRVGDWAIGVIEKEFWGAPHTAGPFVLLTENTYWKGYRYFIDGHPEEGLLTRFLPVVDAPIWCSRSRPLVEATIELRILENHVPRKGGTIVGYVSDAHPSYASGITPPGGSYRRANAEIEVAGPAGEQIVKADQEGIYELSGLPAGDYNLKLILPESERGRFSADSLEKYSVHVDEGRISERNFWLRPYDQ